MADPIEFTVLKSHWGEKDGERHRYEKGETYPADPATMATRVKFGHVAAVDGEADGAAAENAVTATE